MLADAWVESMAEERSRLLDAPLAPLVPQEWRVLDGKIVSFSQMCAALCDEGLSEDELQARWNSLQKVDRVVEAKDPELANTLRERKPMKLVLRAPSLQKASFIGSLRLLLNLLTQRIIDLDLFFLGRRRSLNIVEIVEVEHA